jgi:hypothetical protein
MENIAEICGDEKKRESMSKVCTIFNCPRD